MVKSFVGSDEEVRTAERRAELARVGSRCRIKMGWFCGYRIDSSVVPTVSFQEVVHGPSFVGAPLKVYRLSAQNSRCTVTTGVPGR